MKIVYVTIADIFAVPVSGGALFSKRNLRLLKDAFGEENVYLCLITKNKKALAEASDKAAIFYSNRSKISILLNSATNRLHFGKLIEDYVLRHILSLKCDMVVLDNSRMGTLQERLPEHMKQVLILQNIERDYIRNLAQVNPTRWVLKHAFEANEKIAVKHADIIITLNKRDNELLSGYYNRTSDFTLPITLDDALKDISGGIEPEKTGTEADKTLTLLFAGFRFPPNEQGITWFINNVMPFVNAQLIVAGKGFEDLSEKLGRSNVNVIGMVDDLAQYYRSADAVVSPILIGAGMKVKTAEALMYGKPIFATDEALEGYEVDGIRNIKRCNTAQEFIVAVNGLADMKMQHFAQTGNLNDTGLPYTNFDPDIRALFLDKYHTPGYVPAIRELLLNDVYPGQRHIM